MPITAGDLGQAISYGYKVPFGDSSNALLRGFQAGERQAAHRAASELRRQQAKQKEDEEFNKSLASVNIKDVHPYLYDKAREETATYLNQAQRLYKEDPIKNRFAVKNLINEATNNVYNLQERSKAWYELDKTPDDELSEEGRRLKYLPREYGDARVVEGINSGTTGEGYSNFMPNIRRRKAIDINKARDQVFSDMRQDFINQKQINGDTRILEYRVDDEVAKTGAKLLWPQVKEQYALENIPYIKEKFGSKKSNGALINDPEVQQDLYNKFLGETQKYAKTLGEDKKDDISRPGNNTIVFGNGSAKIGNNVFNYDVTDVNQAQPALKEAGVIKTDADIDFLQGSADFPSISPPAIASGNIQDENGKSVFVDNVKMVYIPGKQEWYAMGNKDGNKKKQIAIPVNEYTIGPVASLYKTDIDKLQSIMDSRLKQYHPASSYSQNQTKALDAFRAQLKREPNASELQKILQKYK